MKQLEELLELWRQDCDIDRTEPDRELLNIPKLHSKYLNILSRHRLLSKESEFKYNKMKKVKWEYYTGKLDDDDLKERGWEPFPFVLKSEINTYLDSDEDLNKYLANKIMHDEITYWDTDGWTFLSTSYDPTGDVLDQLTVTEEAGYVTISVPAETTLNWGNQYKSVVSELPFDLQVTIPGGSGEQDTVWTPVVGTICVLGNVTPGGSL